MYHWCFYENILAFDKITGSNFAAQLGAPGATTEGVGLDPLSTSSVAPTETAEHHDSLESLAEPSLAPPLDGHYAPYESHSPTARVPLESFSLNSGRYPPMPIAIIPAVTADNGNTSELPVNQLPEVDSAQRESLDSSPSTPFHSAPSSGVPVYPSFPNQTFSVPNGSYNDLRCKSIYAGDKHVLRPGSPLAINEPSSSVHPHSASFACIPNSGTNTLLPQVDTVEGAPSVGPNIAPGYWYPTVQDGASSQPCSTPELETDRLVYGDPSRMPGDSDGQQYAESVTSPIHQAQHFDHVQWTDYGVHARPESQIPQTDAAADRQRAVSLEQAPYASEQSHLSQPSDAYRSGGHGMPWQTPYQQAADSVNLSSHSRDYSNFQSDPLQGQDFDDNYELPYVNVPPPAPAHDLLVDSRPSSSSIAIPSNEGASASANEQPGLPTFEIIQYQPDRSMHRRHSRIESVDSSGTPPSVAVGKRKARCETEAPGSNSQPTERKRAKKYKARGAEDTPPLVISEATHLQMIAHMNQTAQSSSAGLQQSPVFVETMTHPDGL